LDDGVGPCPFLVFPTWHPTSFSMSMPVVHMRTTNYPQCGGESVIGIISNPRISIRQEFSY